MTVLWGQGITGPHEEGLASGELVTWAVDLRPQPKMVPLPREEAEQTPPGQVWVRAGDTLGPAQASVCKPGRQLLSSSGLPRRVSKETGILWAPPRHQA